MPERKSDEAKQLAAARAIVRGHLGNVPAEWALAVANGDVPPTVSDNARWYKPRWGRDPTTGRALRKDGTPVRSGRPPGAYTANGSTSANNYANGASHKRKKYANSGRYSKTIMRAIAEALAERSLR
jgi:hypothetical protein